MHQQTGQSDEKLWSELKKGNEKALSELILLFADSLYNYGYMLCRNKELVEDCIQDLFLHLWRKRSTLAVTRNVKTYMMAALRNRIKDSFRKIKGVYTDEFREEELDQESSPEQQWIEIEQQTLQSEIVKRSVEALPARMKQVIYLRYFAGFSYPDIAEIMEVSQQVAVNMVHRAILKLRSASRHYSARILCLFFLETWFL